MILTSTIESTIKDKYILEFDLCDERGNAEMVVKIEFKKQEYLNRAKILEAVIRKHLEQ